MSIEAFPTNENEVSMTADQSQVLKLTSRAPLNTSAEPDRGVLARSQIFVDIR